MAVATTAPAVEPSVSDVYTDTRVDEQHQLCYVDDQIVVLRSASQQDGRHTHRLERRQTFDEYVEAGRFEPDPDSGLDLLAAETHDWAEVAHIGEQTRENLSDAGFETAADIISTDDDELRDVNGIGTKALRNLREYVR